MYHFAPSVVGSIKTVRQLEQICESYRVMLKELKTEKEKKKRFPTTILLQRKEKH
jgi:hypothetical protein